MAFGTLLDRLFKRTVAHKDNDAFVTAKLLECLDQYLYASAFAESALIQIDILVFSDSQLFPKDIFLFDRLEMGGIEH